MPPRNPTSSVPPRRHAPGTGKAPQARPKLDPTHAGALALPHEHDQVPETRADAATRPQPAIAQAGRDLRKGLVDTDNYTRATAVTRRGERAARKP